MGGSLHHRIDLVEEVRWEVTKTEGRLDKIRQVRFGQYWMGDSLEEKSVGSGAVNP